MDPVEVLVLRIVSLLPEVKSMSTIRIPGVV